MPVGRAAQRSSEAETLQEVPPYTLDPPKIGQRPDELRSNKVRHNAEKSCWRPGRLFFELAACCARITL